MLDIFDLQ
uniref:Uncharacterized protein n=1 Tax=Arundo donax TaxID=35708 RepID=A0A0A8ZED1_ARUDO